MRRCRRIGGHWLLLLVFAGQAYAQRPDTASQRFQAIDIVISDEKGQAPAAAGTDLIIQDNGKKRDLVSFRPNGPGSTAVRPSQPVPNVVVLVIDGVNTPSDHDSARMELLQLAQQHIGDREVAAVYVLGQELFTLKAPDGKTGIVDPRFVQDREFLSAEERAQITLTALREIARQWNDQAGRKSVVWVAGGLPVTLEQEKNELFHLRARTGDLNGSEVWGSECVLVQTHIARDIAISAAAISRARLAIYPADARSVVGSMSFIQNFGRQAISEPCLSALSANASELADQTGGRVFSGHEATQRALAAAHLDNATSFQVVFPVADSKPGHFHRLRIKAGSRGLKLLYPHGYTEAENARKD